MVLSVLVVVSNDKKDLFRHLRYFEGTHTNMTDMKKLETRQELLVITMEECGNLFSFVQRHYEEVNFMNIQTGNRT